MNTTNEKKSKCSQPFDLLHDIDNTTFGLPEHVSWLATIAIHLADNFFM